MRPAAGPYRQRMPARDFIRPSPISGITPTWFRSAVAFGRGGTTRFYSCPMDLVQEVSPLHHLTQLKSFEFNAARRVALKRKVGFVRRGYIFADKSSTVANFEPMRFAKHGHGACRRRHYRERLCPA